jgi:hypothetical protein
MINEYIKKRVVKRYEPMWLLLLIDLLTLFYTHLFTLIL